MSIIQKQAPPDRGGTVVRNALRDLWGEEADPSMLGGAALDLGLPLPVYRLRLDDIRDTASIKKARLVGWRYLMEKEGNSAYADVVVTSNGDPSFASLSRNKNAERLNQAAHLAESVAEGLPECEARILDIPALHISAIWLLENVSTFIPYIDADQLRDPEAKISVDPLFLDRIAKRARERR